MAWLEADCCAPAAQASCCEPERKAECCGEHHGAGCGCAAGADPPPTGGSLGALGAQRERDADRNRRP
jgi:hypothetical protein